MKKITILICDDEPGVRESLRIILEDTYTLAFAINGEEAVNHVKTHNPDLTIMDIKMPKMDGLEALRQMKQLNPNVRVLLVTGYESSDVVTQARALGADGYLTKPFNGQKVHEQVHKLLGSAGA